MNVTGNSGMVVSARKVSSEAGLSMMAQGGNAVDAAVCAALMESTVAPTENGLGGYGGSMVIHLASTGRTVAIDYNTRAPGGTSPETLCEVRRAVDVPPAERRPLTARGYGYKMICVPGTLAGLALAHQRYGRRPWPDVVKPALEAAEAGLLVDGHIAGAVRAGRDGLSLVPEAVQLLMPQGRPPEPGERLPMPGFARLLRGIAEDGPEAFYRGEVAGKIASHIQELGGFLSADDLERYEAREVEPLRIVYRGLEVFTSPPANGGITVLQILKILERFDISKYERDPAGLIDLMIAVYRLAWRDRLNLLGDPAFVRVDSAQILSDEYARELAGRIEPPPAEGARPEPTHGTIHVSTMDREGNMAALTQTTPQQHVALAHAQGRQARLHARCHRRKKDHQHAHPGGGESR